MLRVLAKRDDGSAFVVIGLTVADLAQLLNDDGLLVELVVGVVGPDGAEEMELPILLFAGTDEAAMRERLARVELPPGAELVAEEDEPGGEEPAG
jgi:hypothetical protein